MCLFSWTPFQSIPPAILHKASVYKVSALHGTVLVGQLGEVSFLNYLPKMVLMLWIIAYKSLKKEKNTVV